MRSRCARLMRSPCAGEPGRARDRVVILLLPLLLVRVLVFVALVVASGVRPPLKTQS